MPKRYSSQRGFTLMELIIVIVLLSIVAAFAATRFQGASSFSPYAAQAQAISVIRQIQLARMQSNLPDENTNALYLLAVSATCLGAKTACEGKQSLSSKVQVDGQALQFSIDPVPNDGVLQFDLLGRPLPLMTSGNLVTGTSYGITIQSPTNHADTTQICINSEGFVSQGACL